ncbi:MAG: protein-disulfide reductase DsbD domain-containing protein [Planctomycetota bacterium]
MTELVQRITAVAAASIGLLVSDAPAAGAEEDDHPARLSLIAEQAEASPGQTIYLGVMLDMDEDWHTYWPGQNDSGFPLRFSIEAPEGYTVGEPMWPAPERYSATDLVLDYVYHDVALVLVPVEVPSDASEGDASFSVSAEWLVCREACIPGDGTAELAVAIGSSSKVGEHAELFKTARDRVPRSSTSMAMRVRDDHLVVRVPAADVLEFYPHESGRSLADHMTDGRSTQGGLRIRLEPGDEPVRGVVRVTANRGHTRYYWIEIEE